MAKPKPQSSAEAADLFKILRAMSHDDRVSEAHFRIAFRIAQCVDAATGWARIGDDLLMVYLPRTDEKKLRLCRRSLEELGWWRLNPGRRGHATEYLFLPDNVDAILQRAKDLALEVEARSQVERIQERTALQARAMGERVDPETGEVMGSLPGKISLPIGPRKAGKRETFPGFKLPAPLPQSSTIDPSSGTVQDMEQGTHARGIDDDLGCVECGKPSLIRCDETGDTYCAEHGWMARKRSGG